MAGGGVGGLLYAPVIQGLLDNYDWRIVLRCLAFFNLIVQSICSYFITKKIPPAGSSTRSIMSTSNPPAVEIEMEDGGQDRMDKNGEDVDGDKDMEKGEKGRGNTGSDSSGTTAQSSKLYEDPVFLCLFVGSFIVGFGYFVPFYYLPQYVTDHGMSKDFGVCQNVVNYRIM